MTIAEIYDALVVSSTAVEKQVYSCEGTKIFCTGCGRSAKNATTLRHNKGCIEQLYYHTMYDLQKKASRSIDVRVQKALQGQKQ